MPHQTEPSANNALGSMLQKMLPRSTVRSENTQTITGRPSLQPDILVTAPGSSPVVIEAEYLPAYTAEAEAKSRLGLEESETGHIIEAAVALRYPADVAEANDLTAALIHARVSYCVFTEAIEEPVRFPDSGWLDGSVEDLGDLVRLVSVPQRAVDEAATVLQEGIDLAARRLAEVDKLRPFIMPAIARLLGMVNVSQTHRMACAIVANAMVFHEHIAGMYESIKPLDLACGDETPNPQNEIIEAWSEILKVNYWAIFAIARDIVGNLPAGECAWIVRGLRDTALSVSATGVDNAHDLTGRIFQRLIADRKYLATFYTRPASAALLARLAVAKMEGVNWSEAEAIGSLRIGDFACGTGALLSAVYDQISSRHERAGGVPAALHPVMMEEVLYGCDVMPSAIHITGSTLSGVEPSIGFGSSRLYTMAYGRQKEDGSVKIGSLELLQSSTALTLFNTSDPAMRTGSAGEETAAQITADIPDEQFDLVIMNPPFTRAGSDWEGAERQGDSVKQFRGLSTDLETQKAMSNQMKNFAKSTCAHGYAGIASAFAALADKKLKPGGILGLVLPLSAALGISWEKFREMLAEGYTDLMVLSLAATDNDDLSFSADTGMAECLVIARKLRTGEAASDRLFFSSLFHRPHGFAEASAIARKLDDRDHVRSIQDGPYGGTPLMLGIEAVGQMLTTPQTTPGEPWNAVRVADFSLAQTAYELSYSRLWLPGAAVPLALDVVPLSQVGERGFYDMNIAGGSSSAPFTKGSPSPTATYPSLWNHDAQRETQMACVPDSQLLVKPGLEAKAINVWASSSRSHINRDFRFNSQPLTAAFTDLLSIGGRAWPNVTFDDRRFDYCFVDWANSTLGLLNFWWHSNRQVAGRGTNTISAIESLPVLDFRSLSDEQLATAEAIFEEFRDKEFKPAYLADADPNRALLDRRVVCDLLGFDEDTYRAVRRLAAKWCAEPSVHGGKARPQGLTFAD